ERTGRACRISPPPGPPCKPRGRGTGGGRRRRCPSLAASRSDVVRSRPPSRRAESRALRFARASRGRRFGVPASPGSGNGDANALKVAGLGLKAATVTPEGADDVGSPNRILREDIGGRVIVRTGRRIPGVAPLGGVHAPISVVRMAVGDAYGAKEWREGEGDD